MRRFLLFILWAFLGFSPAAFAYPDFIGYGYTSCLTCHYNGHGGGALNDYGRALFATEITARSPFYPKKKSEEDIAAQSGFLGSKELPWWIRPGLKYRGLWIKTNPGSRSSQERFLNMQNELNLNFFADPDQKLSLLTTLGYTAHEGYYGKKNTTFAKEYYLRWQQSDPFWLYVGQLDRVYGIRNVDHTAANRQGLGLGQYDQTQSVVAHYIGATWDVAGQAFFGNSAEETSERQKGFSVSGEYQIQDKMTVGASALSSKSDVTKWNLLGLSTRLGLSPGSAFMAEIGLKERTDLQGSAEAQLGSYAFIETLVKITRGYNFLSTLDHSKNNIQKLSAESTRWSFGALMFPLPRTEIRAMAVQTKTWGLVGASDDAWALQGQVHVSY